MDAFCNEQHILFHRHASTPEGPAPPSVLSAAFRMVRPLISLNIVGCVGMGFNVGDVTVVMSTGRPGGCFSRRISRTVFPSTL